MIVETFFNVTRVLLHILHVLFGINLFVTLCLRKFDPFLITQKQHSV